MDTRRLGLVLILGGAAVTALALIWFIAAYAGAMDMASGFGGDEYAVRMMSCLYASSPICEGAAMLSDGPAYSPVVFWLGLIALLAGVVIRFAAARGASAVDAVSGDAAPAPANGEILGFVPPGQYARYGYILALCGAVGGLILSPLAVVALAGLVLALLGVTAYRPRLNVLDTRHLGFLCLVVVAAALLLLVTRGTFLFLLAALAQIACLYVGFNSYRHGRVIDAQNLKTEFLMALKPGTAPVSGPEQQ